MKIDFWNSSKNKKTKNEGKLMLIENSYLHILECEENRF